MVFLGPSGVGKTHLVTDCLTRESGSLKSPDLTAPIGGKRNASDAEHDTVDCASGVRQPDHSR